MWNSLKREEEICGQEDSIIYSNLSELTQQEIAAFQAADFTLESIPIKPPPKEACFA